VSIESETGEILTGLPAYDDIFVRYTAKFGARPLLTITDEHAERAWPVLERLGMPRGSWFVAVHVREDGLIPAHHSLLRNADIMDCVEAFQRITEAGGWVVRIGNPTMAPLPDLPNVIDYVHTDAVSDWMDIFLLGACRFFLGTDSGPVNVSAVFGRPCTVIDGIPLGHGWFLSDDIYIKKLYWSKSEARHLTFAEIQSTDLRDFVTTEMFEDANLNWVDNTPEEIRELVAEMLEKVSDGVSYTDEDERLQAEWKRLLKLRWTPLSHGIQARAGRDFLRRHSALLSDGQ
jgi:putative glycosyltransferase (TIGR04372 family)